MIEVVTAHPVAVDSLDHQFPFGTKYDNSVSARFNAKLLQLWPSPRLLDLGCSGGGLVRSILDDGGFAVGIEGSDYSKRQGRAEWSVVPDHLFTADITQRFDILEDGAPCRFDVVTAWEVMEHIPEAQLDGLFENVHRHLTRDGVFMVSITSIPCLVEGHEYHETVRPEEWWRERIAAGGFLADEALRQYFDPDFVRGPVTCDGPCSVFRQRRGFAHREGTARPTLVRRPPSSLASLRQLARSRADINSPSGHLFLSRLVRRLVARLTAHGDAHRAEVDVALADWVASLEAWIGDVYIAVDNLEADLVSHVTDLDPRSQPSPVKAYEPVIDPRLAELPEQSSTHSDDLGVLDET